MTFNGLDYYSSNEVAELFSKHNESPVDKMQHCLSNWRRRGTFSADYVCAKGKFYLKSRVDSLMNFAKGNAIDAVLISTFNKDLATPRADLPEIFSEDTSDLSDLQALTLEIKFYLKQTAQNILEVGKRLIAAKILVAHGNWGKYLEDNFGMSNRTAQNFMACAKRYSSNAKSISFLTTTQLIAMLALPSGDEEKFITEKAAAGTPVDAMTIKNLREEIAKWKAENDALKSQQLSLQVLIDTKDKANAELTERVKQLEEEPPTTIETVEVTPSDLKQAKDEVQKFQNELDSAQKTIAALQNQNYKASKALAAVENLEDSRRLALKTFDNLFGSLPSELLQSLETIKDGIASARHFIFYLKE